MLKVCTAIIKTEWQAGGNGISLMSPGQEIIFHAVKLTYLNTKLISTLYRLQLIPRALAWSVMLSMVGNLRMKVVPKHLSLNMPEFSEL